MTDQYNRGRGRDDRDQQRPARIDPRDLGLPSGTVTDPDLVQDALEHAAERGANVLGPVTAIQHVPPDHVIAFRVVSFPVNGGWDDRNTSNGVWYQTDGGKLALHRSALDMLAAAAGMSTVDSDLCTVEPFWWTCKHTVRLKGFDGQLRTVTRSVELDLRDGSPECQKAGRGLLGARRYGARQCESKAANRAIRAALGIQGAYTRQQASRPFVFPILLWTPDTSDPAIKRLVALKELGLTDQLFGPPAAQVTPAVDADVLDLKPADRPAPAPKARQLEDRQNERDFEDAQWRDDGRRPEPVRRTPAHPDDDRREHHRERHMNSSTPPCSQCGKPLSDKVANYSADKFGEPLCYDHQPRGRQ